MDDFISLNDRYVGYPLTIDEARHRYVKERYSASAWAALSREKRDADQERSHPFMWLRLFSSELHAFVQSRETEGWYRIPNGYWFDHNMTIEEIMINAVQSKISSLLERQTYINVPDHFVGQPVIVWREDIDALIAKAPAEAEVAMITLNSVLAGINKKTTDEAAVQDLATPSRVREAECRRVAAELDRQGIIVRSVKAGTIANLWNTKAGKQPNIGAITSLMRGGGDGGRPRKD